MVWKNAGVTFYISSKQHIIIIYYLFIRFFFFLRRFIGIENVDSQKNGSDALSFLMIIKVKTRYAWLKYRVIDRNS